MWLSNNVYNYTVDWNCKNQVVWFNFLLSILTIADKRKKDALYNNHSHVTWAVFWFIYVKTLISADKKSKWETWHKPRMLYVSWLFIFKIQSVVLIQEGDVGKNGM